MQRNRKNEKRIRKQNISNKEKANIGFSLKPFVIALASLFSLSVVGEVANQNSNQSTIADNTNNTNNTNSLERVDKDTTVVENISEYVLKVVPAYSGYASVAVNNNAPFFTTADKSRLDAFEIYSDMDSLNRCGVAYANICKELMPTEEREGIGMIRPSGWHTIKYNDLIDGNYLYNRCHLIGYQLAGENANEKNLITGTRYLNVVGMLPLENMVDDYVNATGNHVLYRVTPIFAGDNLVAYGVLMEAYSVEDKGAGICFCYYCYNVQPGISINYADGESTRE